MRNVVVACCKNINVECDDCPPEDAVAQAQSSSLKACACLLA